MRVLLDTHAFLWWLADSVRLSSAAYDVIADEGTGVEQVARFGPAAPCGGEAEGQGWQVTNALGAGAEGEHDAALGGLADVGVRQAGAQRLAVDLQARAGRRRGVQDGLHVDGRHLRFV